MIDRYVVSQASPRKGNEDVKYFVEMALVDYDEVATSDWAVSSVLEDIEEIYFKTHRVCC